MLAMHEWTKFATQRRNLRVSQPTGSQRSTYWLQLPYRYSIPLLIACSLMHWIISESLFLVRIAIYDQAELLVGEPTPTISTYEYPQAVAGYSPESIAVAIALGGIMIMALAFLASRKFGSDMPLVGNNSSLIGKACQRPNDDEQAASKAVMWGAISHPEGDKPGHCCMTSFKVETPDKGELYTW